MIEQTAITPTEGIALEVYGDRKTVKELAARYRALMANGKRLNGTMNLCQLICFFYVPLLGIGTEGGLLLPGWRCPSSWACSTSRWAGSS